LGVLTGRFATVTEELSVSFLYAAFYVAPLGSIN
jgi:hypothetical protein